MTKKWLDQLADWVYDDPPASFAEVIKLIDENHLVGEDCEGNVIINIKEKDFIRLHKSTRQLLEALKTVEWIMNDDLIRVDAMSEVDKRYAWCPWCGEFAWYGHSEECQREQAIAAAGEQDA